MKKKVRALVLLSGGLDSILAVRVLQEQDIEVVGLSFQSCFFFTQKARECISQLGIELKEVDFSEKHLEMTKKPKNGYGKNMNPCIDCHGMMLQYAKKIMKEEGFDFVATGEVLGQRPMSQNRASLKNVASISGLGERLLRPLSAKHLDETELEKSGAIQRDKLQDIEGRGREQQLKLAKKYNIAEFPMPGGGCLLTDVSFGLRLNKLFTNWPDCDKNDALLLKTGRVYWLTGENGQILIVVGRNSVDNENMLKLKKEDDIEVELVDEPGPLTLIRGINKSGMIDSFFDADIPDILNFAKEDSLKKMSDADVFRLAAVLTGYYATKNRGKIARVRFK